MSTPIFQPFTDRLSRDIRNDLSRSLPTAIRSQTLDPVITVANRYLDSGPADIYCEYINHRISCYRRVLQTPNIEEHSPLFISLILWDERLFFEVHEILEHAWLEAEGEEKLFLQAMIRAAGVYIKREAGYHEIALRIGKKALPVLQSCRHRLAPHTDPERLITALKYGNDPPLLLVNPSTE